jgi:tRNA threonylcarbamoyl adenosine modification protein (Sua5/YciO/YrdC/YwlC family)
MRRLEVDLGRFDPRWADEVARVLEAGGLAAIPTDTVYAFVCDLASRRAVDRLYQAKSMDRRQPLALFLPDLSSVARYAMVSDFAYRVMRRLLPGPFCIELEPTRELPRMLVEKRRVVGIRVSPSELVKALLKTHGRPFLGTGATTPGTDEVLADAQAIADRYGGAIDLVLDAGPLDTVPSTVVSLVRDELVIVRAGKGRLEM